MARRAPKLATTTARPINNPLAHDVDPETYGAAMVKCQGYAPSCSDAGECLFEGFCFSRDGVGFKKARKEIVALLDGNQGDVFTRSWLKLALDSLDQHQFLARGAFDALRLVAISKRVREEYGLK